MTKAQWQFGAQKRVLDLGSSEQSWETSGNLVGHTGPLGRDRMGSAKDHLPAFHILFLGQREDEGNLILYPLFALLPTPGPSGSWASGTTTCLYLFEPMGQEQAPVRTYWCLKVE